MAQTPPSWSVVCTTLQLADLPDYQSPVVEMDVGARCIRLGAGSPNTVLHGERTGSVIRRFVEGQGVDWSKAVVWLQGAEAIRLMERLDEALVRTQLWSGDVVVEWSESAKAAADALFEGIGMALE